MKQIGSVMAIISFLLLIPFSIVGMVERDPTLPIAAGTAFIGGCILLAGGHIAEALRKPT